MNLLLNLPARFVDTSPGGIIPVWSKSYSGRWSALVAVGVSIGQQDEVAVLIVKVTRAHFAPALQFPLLVKGKWVGWVQLAARVLRFQQQKKEEKNKKRRLLRDS